MKIAFIGTGVMGSSMVKNLLKHNHSVNVYNRTLSKATALETYGAKAYQSIEECIKNTEVVITIVGIPEDVEEVYEAIIPNVDKNTVLIDMTTSSPNLAIQIHEKAKQRNVQTLDAPVSGGDIGAQNGTLTIMVGGEKEVFESVLPVFKAMGSTINYIGKAGSGQHCKMANQIAIAGAMEAMHYAIEHGLDFDQVLKAISKGSAASFQLNYTSSKIKENDYAPGFFIKHFIKDMRIAQNHANEKRLLLPVLNQVLKEFEYLQEKGYENLGTQALYKFYHES